MKSDAVDKHGVRTRQNIIPPVKDRLQIQLLLGALFAAGAVVSLVKREWIDAAIAGAVVVLALVAAYRRRKMPDA